MSTKSELYAQLKARGTPSKHYREYTVEELKSLLEAPPEAPRSYADVMQELEEEGIYGEPSPPEDDPGRNTLRSNTPDPGELPGQRANRQGEGPIRVDELGREWYQEEVRKPAYPKPRGRRVLTYLETGVKTETVKVGEYVETFEIAGQDPGRPAEIKITLPSYQVGIYKDPRFPFKVHTYNGRSGFDLFEVHEFYGGAELVPPTCKRIYIENDLCYDMRSVINTITAEHRQLLLTGKIK
jgi:hypothetical protein